MSRRQVTNGYQPSSVWLSVGELRKVFIRIRNSDGLQFFVDTPLAKTILVSTHDKDSLVSTHDKDPKNYALIFEEVILAAHEILRQKDLDLFQLIQDHYLSGIWITRAEAALKYNISETAVTNRLTKAIRTLSKILRDMDQELLDHVSMKTESRLPQKRTYIEKDDLHHIMTMLNPSDFHRIVLFRGIGGVGKTTLAIEAAYKCLENGWYDQAIWIEAKKKDFDRGFIRNIAAEASTLIEVLDRFGDHIGVPAIRKANLEDKEIVFTKILNESKRSYLIIIDNLENVDIGEINKIYEFFRMSTNFNIPHKLLLTSRYNESIYAAFGIPISGFKQNQIRLYIESIIENNKIVPYINDIDIEHIFEATDGNPLIIKILFSKSRDIDHLRDNIDYIRHKNKRDEEVLEYLFGDFFRGITPNQLPVLLIALILPDPISISDIAMILNTRLIDIDNFKHKLMSYEIITDGQRLIKLHPSFIAFLNNDRNIQRSIPNTRKKIYQYYWKITTDTEDIDYERIVKHQNNNIISSIYWSYEDKEYRYCLDISQRILPILERIESRAIYTTILEMALLVSDILCDMPTLSELLIKYKGSIYKYTDSYDEALAGLQRGIKIAEDLGNHKLAAIGYKQFGALFRDFPISEEDQEDKLPMAVQMLAKAIDMIKECNDENELMEMYGVMASIRRKQKHFEAAEQLLYPALSKTQEGIKNTSDYKGIAIAHGRLGTIYFEWGLHLYNQEQEDRALELFEQADNAYDIAIHASRQASRYYHSGIDLYKRAILHTTMHELGINSLEYAQVYLEEATTILTALGGKSNLDQLEQLAQRILTLDSALTR